MSKLREILEAVKVLPENVNEFVNRGCCFHSQGEIQMGYSLELVNFSARVGKQLGENPDQYVFYTFLGKVNKVSLNTFVQVLTKVLWRDEVTKNTFLTMAIRFALKLKQFQNAHLLTRISDYRVIVPDLPELEEDLGEGVVVSFNTIGQVSICMRGEHLMSKNYYLMEYLNTCCSKPMDLNATFKLKWRKFWWYCFNPKTKYYVPDDNFL